MAFFDWLFGDSDPAPVTYQSTSKQDIPEWIEEPSKRMIAEAERLAGLPYEAYTGERVAPFSPESLQAMDRSQALAGQGADRVGLGYLTAAGSTRAPTSEELQTYIDPYAEGVAGIAAREMERAANIRGIGERAQAVRAGAFGGDRQAIQEAERERNLQQQTGDIYTRTMSRAYETGLSELGKQLEREQRGGIALGQLGAQGQQVGFQDIAQQLGIGQLIEGKGQEYLDVGYQDYLTQQQYPYEQLGFLSDIVRGAPRSTSTTGTQQAPGQTQPGFFQQVAGLGIAGLGTAGQLGWRPFS